MAWIPSISEIGPVAKFLDDWDECAGRTIKRVDEENVCGDTYLVIRFEDGTAYATGQSYDDDGWRSYSEQFDDKSDEPKRVHFGQVSVADFMANEEASEGRRQAEREANERAELQRLQSKYAR